jgi:hypothetical protein
MSAAHKAALAEGREQGVIVRRHLEALESAKQGVGRGRSAQSIARRIQVIRATMATADVLVRLELITETERLEAELQDLDDASDLLALEADFVAVAAAYSIRRGISYASWRTVRAPFRSMV